MCAKDWGQSHRWRQTICHHLSALGYLTGRVCGLHPQPWRNRPRDTFENPDSCPCREPTFGKTKMERRFLSFFSLKALYISMLAGLFEKTVQMAGRNLILWVRFNPPCPLFKLQSPLWNASDIFMVIMVQNKNSLTRVFVELRPKTLELEGKWEIRGVSSDPSHWLSLLSKLCRRTLFWIYYIYSNPGLSIPVIWLSHQYN